MSKKTETLTVGPDRYKIIVADDGSIESADGTVRYATAAEVRSIAAESKRLYSQEQRDPVRRTASGYDICYRNAGYHGDRKGAVQIGCQELPYKTVQKVAALSAARGARRKPAAVVTRRRAAARK